MNYDQVIELHDMTIDDCIKLMEYKKYVILNDGILKDIVLEEGDINE